MRAKMPLLDQLDIREGAGGDGVSEKGVGSVGGDFWDT